MLKLMVAKLDTGLHFNKFTDSCDYANNVLCKVGDDEPTTTIRPFLSADRAKFTTELSTTTTFKPLIRVKSKKVEKTTTTTTTTTTRPTTRRTTTARRTTTTTTEAPEAEYEYEDEYPTSEEKLEDDSEAEPELQHLLQLIADLGRSIIKLFENAHHHLFQ